MSIGVKINPGLVADNAPHLEPDGSKLTSGEQAGAIAAGAASVARSWSARRWSECCGGARTAVTSATPAWPRAPSPLAGQTADVVANDPDIEIPVAFTPPRIPVAEAGLLIDGQVDTRETAATIIDLAVRGALKVQSTGEDDFRVTLVDPERAAAPHEMVLLTSLFDGEPPGADQRTCRRRAACSTAHTKMRDSVRNQVTARGWFRKVPSASATSSFGFGAIALAVFRAFSVGAWVLWVLVPLLPIIITLR